MFALVLAILTKQRRHQQQQQLAEDNCGMVMGNCDSGVQLSLRNQAAKFLHDFLFATTIDSDAAGSSSSSSASAAADLWRLHLMMENQRCLTHQAEYLKKLSKYSQPADQMEPLKTLLFRALQDCPGSKALFLDAIKYYTENPAAANHSAASTTNQQPPMTSSAGAASGLAASCRNELQELMTEKELRVRIP